MVYAHIIAFLLSLTALSSAQLIQPGTEAKKFINVDATNQHRALRDFVGSTATTPRDLLILNFWSISCIPCRAEMPILQEWVQNYYPTAELLFINVDKREQQQQVLEYIKQNNINSTVLMDYYQTTAKAYGVCNDAQCMLPSLYVINGKTGIISLAQTGFESAEKLHDALNNSITTPSAPTNTPAVAPEIANFGNSDKFQLLHQILLGLPHDQIAAENNLTRAQLIEILKEVETAAKEYWKKP